MTSTEETPLPDVQTFIRTDPGFHMVCTLVLVSLVVLAVVRILHGFVTRRYMEVKGLDGLANEERQTENLSVERARLEEAIQRHEATIRKEKELQAFIQKLAG